MINVRSMQLRLLFSTIFLFSALTSRLHSQTSDTSRYPARERPTHGLSVHAEYDAKYDKTVLQLDPVALDSSLEMSVLVSLDGRPVRTEAPGVVMTFRSTAPMKRFQTDRSIIVQIDGAAPLDLGKAWLVPNPREGFTEIMLASTNIDRWLALAKAKRVTMKVGALTYELPPQLLAAFRDFASRMAPEHK